MSWKDKVEKFSKNIIGRYILKEFYFEPNKSSQVGAFIKSNSIFMQKAKKVSGTLAFWQRPPKVDVVKKDSEVPPRVYEFIWKRVGEYYSIDGKENHRVWFNPFRFVLWISEILKITTCQIVDYFFNNKSIEPGETRQDDAGNYLPETYRECWNRLISDKSWIPARLQDYIGWMVWVRAPLQMIFEFTRREIFQKVIPVILFSVPMAFYYLYRGIRYKEWDREQAKKIFVDTPQKYLPMILKAPLVVGYGIVNSVLRAIAFLTQLVFWEFPVYIGRRFGFLPPAPDLENQQRLMELTAQDFKSQLGSKNVKSRNPGVNKRVSAPVSKLPDAKGEEQLHQDSAVLGIKEIDSGEISVESNVQDLPDKIVPQEQQQLQQIDTTILKAPESPQIAEPPVQESTVTTMHFIKSEVKPPEWKPVLPSSERPIEQQRVHQIKRSITLPALKQYLIDNNMKIRNMKKPGEVSVEAEAILIILNSPGDYKNLSKEKFIQYCLAAFSSPDGSSDFGEIYEAVKQQAEELELLKTIAPEKQTTLSETITKTREEVARFDLPHSDLQENEEWTNIADKVKQLKILVHEKLNFSTRVQYLKLAESALSQLCRLSDKLKKLNELKAELISHGIDRFTNMSPEKLTLLASTLGLNLPGLQNQLSDNTKILDELNRQIKTLEIIQKHGVEQQVWLKKFIVQLVNGQLSHPSEEISKQSHDVLSELMGSLHRFINSRSYNFNDGDTDTDDDKSRFIVLKDLILKYRPKQESSVLTPVRQVDISLKRKLEENLITERNPMLNDIQGNLQDIIRKYKHDDNRLEPKLGVGSSVQYSSPNQGQNKFMRQHGVRETLYDKEKHFIRDTIAALGNDQFRKNGQQPVIQIKGHDVMLLRVAYAYTLAFGFKAEVDPELHLDKSDIQAKADRYRKDLVDNQKDLYETVCYTQPAPQLTPPPLASMLQQDKSLVRDNKH